MENIFIYFTYPSNRIHADEREKRWCYNEGISDRFNLRVNGIDKKNFGESIILI